MFQPWSYHYKIVSIDKLLDMKSMAVQRNVANLTASQFVTVHLPSIASRTSCLQITASPYVATTVQVWQVSVRKTTFPNCLVCENVVTTILYISAVIS